MLSTYQLPTDLNVIKNYPPNGWKFIVCDKIDEKNKKRLVLESHKIVDGKSIPKTKTSAIVEKLNNTGYRRKPELEIKEKTKQ